MEARLLIRYFVLIHLGFTLVNGHPLLDSLFLLGNGTVGIDLYAIRDQRSNTKNVQFHLTTVLDVVYLRDIVKIIAEKHRYKMNFDYTTDIRKKHASRRGNYVDGTNGDHVSDSKYSELPQNRIGPLSKNDTTWKKNSTARFYKDVKSDEKEKNYSSPSSHTDSPFLNAMNDKSRKDGDSDKTQNIFRDLRRNFQIVLINEISFIMRDAFNLVKRWSRMRKNGVEDFLNIEEYIKRRDEDHDKDIQQRLLNLYVDAKILHRELFKNSALRNGREPIGSNDRASSYDDQSKVELMKHKSHAGDQYNLRKYLDWLTQNQTSNTSTVNPEATTEKISENPTRNITQLKKDSTDSLKIDPVSENDKPINRMYNNDVAANETAVRFEFENLQNPTVNDINQKSHSDNLSSTINNTFLSEIHNTNYKADSEDIANILSEHSTERDSNIKNVSVTHDNKTSEGNSNMRKAFEDTTKYAKITTKKSNEEVTKVKDIQDGNVKNALPPSSLEVNETSDDNDDMKNTTIIYIKDLSKNVMKNIAIPHEFRASPNSTVAARNTKKTASSMIENERSNVSKDNNEKDQFVMDHILDAVDKVFLFD